jgi:rhodanese-related sulfurtransferase
MAPSTPQVREIDAATASQWLSSGAAVLVDVREPDEHARESITGSRLAPLSRLDPTAFPADGATKLVVHCKGGVRSAQAAARLVSARGTDVYSLRGGIDAWKAAGLPTQVNRSAPMPIMRQVQIVAGSFVLAGTVLAAAVSPWFLIITGFFGAGLVFAGTTGLCGMAALLARMPWNRSWACAGGQGSGQC